MWDAIWNSLFLRFICDSAYESKTKRLQSDERSKKSVAFAGVVSQRGECLLEMSQWKRRFWTEQRPHAKNGLRKRNVIMRLLWYNRVFAAGWRESNMNEGSCKFAFAPRAPYSFHNFDSHHLDRIWMNFCPKTAPKVWPLASISNPAPPFTIVRVAFCLCSMKNRQRIPNGWNVSAAICLPRWNRRVRNSATSELHWTKNWASHGFDTSSCCCTNVVFAWKNWNQVSSSIRFDEIKVQWLFFGWQKPMRKVLRWPCICTHLCRSRHPIHGHFWSKRIWRHWSRAWSNCAAILWDR